MPLNFTPATQSPETPNAAPAVKYTPSPRPGSMYGNTAPIAGQPPAPDSPAANDNAEQGAPEGAQEQQPQDVGWRLGKVAKKERQARELMQAAKAAEAQARAREQALADREARIAAEEERRAVWRQNPKALLQEYGYVPEAVVQYMLNGEKLTPEQQLAAQVDQRLADQQRATEERLEALRQEQAAKEAEREAELARQQEQQLSQQEQVAVQELHADIGDIVAGDARAFPLVRRAGDRGIAAIYNRVNELWQEQTDRLGRQSPITTKMLERAAAEVEAAARKELQEGLADPEIAAALGVGAQARAPVRQRTLTNQAPPAVATQSQTGEQESPAQRYERVKAEVARRLAGGRG